MRNSVRHSHGELTGAKLDISAMPWAVMLPIPSRKVYSAPPTVRILSQDRRDLHCQERLDY